LVAANDEKAVLRTNAAESAILILLNMFVSPASGLKLETIATPQLFPSSNEVDRPRGQPQAAFFTMHRYLFDSDQCSID
jgi:hypothetical protein